MVFPSVFPLIAYDTVDSTMTEAKRLIETAQGHSGDFIVARHQTHGRGRFNRPWVSQTGNFMGSLILKLPYPPLVLAQLSFVTALTVGESVQSLVSNAHQVWYKWPNDILMYDRKISGILLEVLPCDAKGWYWLVIGMGVNLVSCPQDVPLKTTCVEHWKTSSEILTPHQFYTMVCTRFSLYSRLWEEKGFDPIRKAWLEKAYAYGGFINVRTGDKKEDIIKGKFLDMDQEGRLILETAPGIKRAVVSGDVSFCS